MKRFLTLIVILILALQSNSAFAKPQRALLKIDGINYKNVDGTVSLNSETSTVSVSMVGTNASGNATLNLTLQSSDLLSLGKGDSFDMVTGNEEDLGSTVDKVVLSFNQLANQDRNDEYTIATGDGATVRSGVLRIVAFNPKTNILTCTFRASLIGTLATDTFNTDNTEDDSSFNIEEAVPVSGKFFLQLK